MLARPSISTLEDYVRPTVEHQEASYAQWSPFAWLLEMATKQPIFRKLLSWYFSLKFSASNRLLSCSLLFRAARNDIRDVVSALALHTNSDQTGSADIDVFRVGGRLNSR